LGGLASLLRVKLLRDRTFKFTVASRAIGFKIYNKGRIYESLFEYFINVWGQGGPNLLIEERKYYSELQAQWQVVQRKKSSSVFNILDFHAKD
jgi:hypothetical protein